MARSVKKGPFIQQALLTRVEAMNSSNAKRVIKTWARSSTIIPDFVGHTFTAKLVSFGPLLSANASF